MTTSADSRTTLAGFARAVWAERPAAVARVVVLLVLTSLTEGVGLLFLVPMLSLVGVAVGGGAMDGITRALGGAMRWFELPLTLPAVLGATIVVVGLRAALQQAETVSVTRLAVRIERTLRTRLFRAVIAMPWPLFARSRGSDLVHALTVQPDQVEFAVRELLRLAAESLTMAVTLAIALGVSWRVTLLVCGAGVVLLLLLRVVRVPGRADGERLIELSEALFRSASDHMAGMKTVKGYGAEGRTVAAFERSAADYSAAAIRTDRARSLVATTLALGTVAMLSAMVYVGVAALRLSPGALLLLLAVYARLVPRAASMQQGWQHLNESLAAWDSVRALTLACERAAPAPAGPASPRAVAPRHAAPVIGFDRVSYRYVGTDWAALRDATFTIPAGAITAVVGPSGAGKSTAADLLLGLLRPDAGALLVDGVPLGDDARAAWTAAIGLMPQDVFLFPGTIRENLEWAHPGAREDDLRRALDAAAAGFVSSLPNGLDAVIGDRGVLLSGGERQRLALARALLRSPALLILDEATSALDLEQEARILAALRALTPRVTTVLVSHRLSVVRAADHVVVIDGGEVVGEGRWSELERGVERVRELFVL